MDPENRCSYGSLTIVHLSGTEAQQRLRRELPAGVGRRSSQGQTLEWQSDGARQHCQVKLARPGSPLFFRNLGTPRL